MEIIISPEIISGAVSVVVAALLDAIRRHVQRRSGSDRIAQTNVAVSVNHGLAGTDVVVRVSSDLNKSSRDLCS